VRLFALSSTGLKVTVFTPLLTGGSVAVPANSAILAWDEWPMSQAAHTLRFVVGGPFLFGGKCNGAVVACAKDA
jgi:hypothetical protein